MKKLLYFMFANLFCISVWAQDLGTLVSGNAAKSAGVPKKTFSRKKHASDNPIHGAFSPYKPSPEFLQLNPNFLKDSTYDLASKGLKNINSTVYPIKSVQMKKALDRQFTYCIVYGDPATERWWGGAIRSKFKKELRDDRKYHNKRYWEANAGFQQAIENAAGNEADNFKILDIKSFLPEKIKNKTVYLAIEEGIGVNDLVLKKKDKMPWVVSFRMFVINNLYDTLQSYTQSVLAAYPKKMFDESNKMLCLRQALPNLLAQFTNDVKVQELLAKTIDTTQYLPDYLASKEALQKLRQTQMKKMMIIDVLKSDYDMQSQAESMAQELTNQMTFDAVFSPLLAIKQQPVTSTDIIANGIGQAANMVFGYIAQKSAEKKAARGNQLIQQYRDLQDEEARLFETLRNTSLIGQSEFAGKEFTKSQLIDEMETALNSGAAKVKNQLASGAAYMDNKLKSQLTMQVASTATASIMTPDLSKVQSPGAASDPCSKDADMAWRNSSEYRAYQQNPTNANASYSKAKLIELTLQYCGSKLPANEVQALRAAAAQEKKLADQLRAQTPKINLSH